MGIAKGTRSVISKYIVDEAKLILDKGTRMAERL